MIAGHLNYEDTQVHFVHVADEDTGNYYSVTFGDNITGKQWSTKLAQGEFATLMSMMASEDGEYTVRPHGEDRLRQALSKCPGECYPIP
tara:strand:+ start:11631 stop:11897 length:267 start_codon:yes stop_codon:yes gene_type:complete